MSEPETERLNGVQIWEAEGFADDQGLMCVTGYRASKTAKFLGYGDLLVMTLDKGKKRGFHYHEHATDTIVGLAGKFRIVLYDMREDSPTRHRIQEVLLEPKPKGVLFLQVPPMVAHAFQGLVDGSVLVDIPSSEEVASGDFFRLKEGTVPYEFRAA